MTNAGSLLLLTPLKLPLQILLLQAPGFGIKSQDVSIKQETELDLQNVKMTSLYGRIHQQLEPVDPLVWVLDTKVQMEQMNVGLQQIRILMLYYGLKSMDVKQIQITIAYAILLKDGKLIQLVVNIVSLMLWSKDRMIQLKNVGLAPQTLLIWNMSWQDRHS